MDFLASVLALPVIIIKRIFKHPKIFIFLGLVLVIVFAGFKVLSPSSKPIPAQATGLPPPKATQLKYPSASYAVQTSSRLYFVDDYTDMAGIIKAMGYWDYSSKKWVYHKTALVVDRKYYGDVKVYATN
jgi:hypothetical protein